MVKAKGWKNWWWMGSLLVIALLHFPELGNAEINAEENVRLQITQQPQNQIISPPDSAQFSVRVSGGKQPLTYEWHLNQLILKGQNVETFTIKKTNATEHNGAKVYVVITDADGKVIRSNEANLTVNRSQATTQINPLPTIDLDLIAVGIGLGGTWGSGVLSFKTGSPGTGDIQEEKYYFSVQGFNLAEVGLAKIHSSGYVYGLTNPDQIRGTFGGIGGDFAIGGGAGITRLWNQHGVMIALYDSLQGIHLGLLGKSLVIE